MKKNDIIELTIEDMSVDGCGIGKLHMISEKAEHTIPGKTGHAIPGKTGHAIPDKTGHAMTFFVKDAVVGDKIRAKIMKLKKTYGYARLLEIMEPSSDRTEPKCPWYRQCGGCQIQALSYEKQLEYKEKKVKNNLIRIGGFHAEHIPMEPIIGMKDPFHYRNKAQFPVGRDKNRKLIAGFYATHTHNIIPVQNCYLGVPQNQQVMQRVLSWMEQYQIEPYEEQNGTGLVRHVLIRYGFRTNQLMVCLVVNAKSLPKAPELIDKLMEIEGMASISMSTNEQRNNVIMGETVTTLYGANYIEDYIGDIKFQISPLSFYQVNPVQTEVLYRKVLEFAGLNGREIVWDLYCGIGTISLFLAQRAKKVYGIEVVPQAVEDARMNARVNGIENVEFIVGKAENALEQIGKLHRRDEGEQESEIWPQVIVVDPPRKGCDERLLETIVELKPERVVYVSCDSATLARDLRYLCWNGYGMERVQAVDQFCHTAHVESIVLLSKLHTKQNIEVELEMSELDLTAAESKATYEEIKDYVLKQSGLKVSNLYIAQVKQKCGIIERVNYNQPKSENSRQPKCPPEKEAAIREALEYFRMI